MDMVNISLSTAAITGLLGYVVVFVGLILLMLVIMLMSKMFIAKANAAKAEPAAVEAAPAAVPAKPEAPGTAGELKLYGTPDRDAALIMAIVAHKMGKPLNTLRFKSIKEVQ